MLQFVVQLETLCKKNFDDNLIKIKPKVVKRIKKHSSYEQIM